MNNNKKQNFNLSSLKPQKIFLHLLLIIGVLFTVLPFFHLFMTAFKTYEETVAVPMVWMPSSFSLEGFKEVFSKLPFAKMLSNSIIKIGRAHV